MEEVIQPILEFINRPNEMDFDDDISLLIASIIKLSGEVTETCKVLFPLTVKIHGKYKGVFGNLLVSLNLYLKQGAPWIAEVSDRVKILHDMSMISMFYNVQKGLCKTSNADGSFLL